MQGKLRYENFIYVFEKKKQQINPLICNGFAPDVEKIPMSHMIICLAIPCVFSGL